MGSRWSELISGPDPERVKSQDIVSCSPETWQLRDQAKGLQMVVGEMGWGVELPGSTLGPVPLHFLMGERSETDWRLNCIHLTSTQLWVSREVSVKSILLFNNGDWSLLVDNSLEVKNMAPAPQQLIVMQVETCIIRTKWQMLQEVLRLALRRD